MIRRFVHSRFADFLRGRIQRDPDGRCHGDGLMHCAAMRHLQEPFLLLCADAMGKVDSDVDTTDTMRNFSHRPFRIDRQTVSRNAVPPAELPDEVCDTARNGADEEFNRTHAGILPSVLHRLVGDDPMLAAHHVVARPAVKGGREFHVVSPGHAIPLPLTNAAFRTSRFPTSIRHVRRLAALRPIMDLVGKVWSRLSIDVRSDIDRFIIGDGPSPTSRHIRLDE